MNAAIEYAINAQHSSNLEFLSSEDAKTKTGFASNHWLILITAFAPRQANNQEPTDAQKLLIESLRVAWRDEESQDTIQPQIAALHEQYEIIVRNAMRDGFIDNSLDVRTLARLFLALPIGLSTLTLGGVPDVDPMSFIAVFQRIDEALKPK